LETIFGIKQIQKKLTSSVVTLGVFDGVHLGHQEVIKKTINLANERNGESVILTFDRHPKSVLSQTQQSCITSLEHRLVLLCYLLFLLRNLKDRIRQLQTRIFQHNYGPLMRCLFCPCQMSSQIRVQ